MPTNPGCLWTGLYMPVLLWAFPVAHPSAIHPTWEAQQPITSNNPPHVGEEWHMQGLTLQAALANNKHRHRCLISLFSHTSALFFFFFFLKKKEVGRPSTAESIHHCTQTHHFLLGIYCLPYHYQEPWQSCALHSLQKSVSLLTHMLMCCSESGLKGKCIPEYEISLYMALEAVQTTTFTTSSLTQTIILRRLDTDSKRKL